MHACVCVLLRCWLCFVGFAQRVLPSSRLESLAFHECLRRRLPLRYLRPNCGRWERWLAWLFPAWLGLGCSGGLGVWCWLSLVSCGLGPGPAALLVAPLLVVGASCYRLV